MQECIFFKKKKKKKKEKNVTEVKKKGTRMLKSNLVGHQVCFFRFPKKKKVVVELILGLLYYNQVFKEKKMGYCFSHVNTPLFEVFGDSLLLNHLLLLFFIVLFGGIYFISKKKKCHFIFENSLSL